MVHLENRKTYNPIANAFFESRKCNFMSNKEETLTRHDNCTNFDIKLTLGKSPGAQRGGTTSQVDNTKASLRIFVANAGGLLYTAMHLVGLKLDDTKVLKWLKRIPD